MESGFSQNKSNELSQNMDSDPRFRALVDDTKKYYDPKYVIENAEREFKAVYPDAFKAYKEMEKTRVYDRPVDDPALREALSVNLPPLIRSGFSTMDDSTIGELERHRALEAFTQKFPEKAEAYATQVPGLEAVVGKSRQKMEKDISEWLLNSKREARNIELQINSLSTEEFHLRRQKFAQEYAEKYQAASAKVGKDKMVEIENHVISEMEKMKEFDAVKLLQQDEGYQERIKPGSSPEQTKESAESEDEGDIKYELDKEKFKSNEFVRNMIVENDLSYQDTDLPEMTKKQMAEWSKSSPSAMRYGEMIEFLASKESLNNIRKEASRISTEAKEVLEHLEVPQSAYAKSNTWAMWDIGKQFYFYAHPDERQEGYVAANPLTSKDKRQEIIDRHVGWEAYQAFNDSKNVLWRQKIENNTRYAEAIRLLQKAPKPNKTLSSRDLATLGKLLRIVGKSK